MNYLPSLDNGYRSWCCRAPIRIGWKTARKTKNRVKIWVCTNCKARDVQIVPKNVTDSQVIQEESISDLRQE